MIQIMTQIIVVREIRLVPAITVTRIRPIITMEQTVELMLAANKGKITIRCCKRPASEKMTPWRTKSKI